MIRKYLFVLTLLLIIPAAWASSLSKQQQQLKELNQQITQMRQGIKTEQQQQTLIQQTLTHNQAVIEKLNQQLTKNKQRLQLQQQHLAELEHQRMELKQRLQQQQQILVQQIRLSYQLSLQHQMYLSHAQHDYTLQYLNYLNQARAHWITQLQTTALGLNKHQQQTKQQAEQLQIQQQQTQTQQHQLLQEHQQHQKVLVEINSEISDRQQQLATLLANKQALEKLIQQLQRRPTQFVQPHAPFGDSKIKLNWPTKGTIIKHFGTPIDQSGLKYAGIFLKAPLGQEVVSIYPGRIIFANWLAGYGWLIIIDHGNGYMSLYGYNNNLRKKVGDIVRAGESIASIGDSSNQGQPGLYFEIRFNGHPVDPQLWCH